MNKKYLLLVGLLPIFYPSNKTTYQLLTSHQSSKPVINEETTTSEACTVMYVGKNVSSNGKAIIARSSDAGPGAMNINVTIFPHNALANKIVNSHKGFSYKMPSTTYQYISTPRNPVINKGHHWEASAINENGVGVSATLSCITRDEMKQIDDFVPNGIGEDNIAEIVGATATTAREGMQIIGNIIDEQGSCEANAIMTIDQNEAWYMEIYGGHLYIAIKLPDDKILTAGNEYILDSLNTMNISDDNVILSKKNLYEVADKNGIKQPDNCQNLRDLNLSDTFGMPYTEEKRITFDNCHRRTWRGLNLYKNSEYKVYKSTDEYPALYSVDENRKLSIHDVEAFMRDRFEDILNDENNDNYPAFHKDDLEHNLRYIGIENAYQVHVIQSDPNLPKYIAAIEWLSISNANYTPFVPISLGATRLPDYYVKVSDSYSYDNKSAANIFKKLNTLARNDRINYGLPIQKFWETYEMIWDEEYSQLLMKTQDMNINARCERIKNYINQTLNMAVETALFMIDDLTWHMMNDSFEFGTPTKFKPCINVKDYARIYGYSYEKITNTVKFARGDEKYTLTLVNKEFRPDTSKDYRSLGEISYGEVKDNIDMVINNQDVYVPLESLTKYIKGNINLNINDYKTPFDHSVWIIPVTVGVPIVFAITIYLVNKKRKGRI